MEEGKLKKNSQKEYFSLEGCPMHENVVIYVVTSQRETVFF
jgi:hypothetical protein